MKKILLFIVFNFSLHLCFSQNVEKSRIPDSLTQKSYKYLEDAFDNNLKNQPEKAEFYANYILVKGRADNNESKIVASYLFLFKSKANPIYLDSLIAFGTKNQNFENISLGYLKKGNYYYSNSKYSIALSNYLLARDFSIKNPAQYQTINFNIGLLKLELENYGEAKKLFLSYKKYLEHYHLTSRKDYISSLYAIALTESKINNLNVSDSYANQGIEKAIKINDKENYANLLLVSGINQYKRKVYSKSIEILTKVSKVIQDNSYDKQNLAISEFYIGMNLYESNNAGFVDKFELVDEIIYSNKDANRELIDLYPILIEYFKKNGDKEKQLFYIEHLLEVTDIVNNSERNLSKEINSKYDTPNLLKQKEKLIRELNFKNSISYFIVGGFAILSFLLLLLFFKNKNKIKYYKEQAVLLTKTSEPIILNEKSNLIELEPEEKKSPIVKSTLSDEILDFITQKLKQFEENKDYLSNTLTLDNLAKDFSTNRAYLSKSIKELKGKSYSHYVNDLRIKFIIKELKTNPKVQKLTIAAIGEKAGFNNAESFSNAFKKVTRTLPSYYLKALNSKI